MKDENEPVSPGEYVIRMIWMDHYKQELALPIQPGAFTPKKNESDGISVFRSDCLKSPEDVLAVIAEEKREKYAISMLKVLDLIALGLSISPAKVDAIPGHGVIPELNAASVKANALHWREIKKKLATLANQNIIRPIGTLR